MAQATAIGNGPDMAGLVGPSELFNIFRRRKWWIFAVILTGFLATLVAIALMEPLYEGVVLLQVKPPAVSPGERPAGGNPTAGEELRITSDMQELKSGRLLARAAETMRLDKDPEFAQPPRHRFGLLRRLTGMWASRQPPAQQVTADEMSRAADDATFDRVTAKMGTRLSVDRVGTSDIIRLGFESESPIKASRVANHLADTYIYNQISAALQRRRGEIDNLAQRVSQMRSRVIAAEAATAAYKRAHGLFSSSPEEINQLQLTQLRGLLADSSAAAVESGSRAGNLTAAIREGGAGSASAIANSPLLADLRLREAERAAHLAQLTGTFGAGYPEVAQTRRELEEIRRKIAGETQRLDADLRNEVAIKQGRQHAISAMIAGVQARNARETSDLVGLRELERQETAMQTAYVELLTQLREKSNERDPTDVADVAVVSRSGIPSTPAYPPSIQLLVVAIVGFTMVGGTVALIVEVLDDRFRTSRQVTRKLGLSTLATVPELRRKDAREPDSVVTGKPRSLFAEAMRNLLVELEVRVAPGAPRVILVTSPLEHDGKSTIATGLAAAAAATNLKAILVDLDLRRRGAADEEEASRSVSDYLISDASVDEIVAKPPQRAFSIVTARGAPVDPNIMIASNRLPELLHQLRQRFDVVVLNAPPLIPVRDAKILAAFADASLLVLRWGKTRPTVAELAMQIYDRPFSGAVLSRVNVGQHIRGHYADALHHAVRSSYRADDLQGYARRRFRHPFRAAYGWMSRAGRRFTTGRAHR